MKKVKPLCSKCSHRGFCREPCHPVELLLDDVSAKYFAEYDQGGQVLVKNWRQRYFYQHASTEDGQNEQIEDCAENKLGGQEDFLDIPENRLGLDVDPNASLQTKVFVGRVWYGKDRSELSVELNRTPKTLDTYYKRAKDRVARILEFMTRREAAVCWQKNTRHNLSDEQKGFILYKIFGLPYREVKTIIDVPSFKQFSRTMRRLEKSYVGQ